MFEAFRQKLTHNGRMLAQDALAWIWAKHERMVPIPGPKTVKHVREYAVMLEFGPLGERQMEEIANLLKTEESL